MGAISAAAVGSEAEGALLLIAAGALRLLKATLLAAGFLIDALAALLLLASF